MAQQELNHDAVTEILLRLPPDDPACLVRAALVCKPWCRTLTDPAFICRYREFHRTPPLLGFLHSSFNKDLKRLIPRFVPTTAAPPFPNPPPYCDQSTIEDCRHGRVLLLGPKGRFVVWDPITGEWEELKSPRIPCMSYAVAVLCATAGCDHHDCHGGPFRVLILGLDRRLGPVHARVYSSKTRDWGTPVSLDTDTDSWFELECGALIRDELYYRILHGKILEYDLGKNGLSLIDPPPYREMFDDWGSFVLMLMEDGSLGFVGARGSSLYVWSRKVKPDGVVVGWVQLKVVELELEKLVPTRSEKEGKLEPKLIGSAQGVDVVFMRTDVGVFMFEFKSGQARKVCDNYYGTPRNVFAPFMSFSAPGASPYVSM